MELSHSCAEIGAKAGKYLAFRLCDEMYAIEILKVQEIIGIMKITLIPRLPRFMRGVINLRGKVVPVLDLRLKLGMRLPENTDRTCIIVVNFPIEEGMITLGAIVDEVSEVIHFADHQIEPPPLCGGHDMGLLTGVGKVGERVFLLLDPERVFGGQME